MKLTKKIKIFAATLASFFVLATPAVALAQAAPAPTPSPANKDAVCEGVALTGGNCHDGSANGSIDSIVKNAVNLFSILIGIVSVIMIMVGGFKYITSQGDSNNINSAKNTILYAIIGLVVAAFAQIIVQFVLERATPGNNGSGVPPNSQQQPPATP